eukprot:1159764-Pelagomonas_calceolata.AAC.16
MQVVSQKGVVMCTGSEKACRQCSAPCIKGGKGHTLCRKCNSPATLVTRQAWTEGQASASIAVGPFSGTGCRAMQASMDPLISSLHLLEALESF